MVTVSTERILIEIQKEIMKKFHKPFSLSNTLTLTEVYWLIVLEQTKGSPRLNSRFVLILGVLVLFVSTPLLKLIEQSSQIKSINPKNNVFKPSLKFNISNWGNNLNTQISKQ